MHFAVKYTSINLLFLSINRLTFCNTTAPENNVEYVFSTLCLTLALVTNAVIIGSATNLLSNMDAGAVARKAQMDGINGYMRFQKVWARHRDACGGVARFEIYWILFVLGRPDVFRTVQASTIVLFKG